MLISADYIVIDGQARSGVGIVIGADGRIAAIDSLQRLGTPDRILRGRVLLPGFVNAHSHAFQRLLRGRTQHGVAAGADNFWSWRQAMYGVASALDPDSIYVASRQAFIEMALSGTTTVGEFHYVHHAPDGSPYGDRAAMSKAVVKAAIDAGVRICLLNVIYLRGDFDRPPDALQRRFCDPDLDTAWDRVQTFTSAMLGVDEPLVTCGVAAHSIRAVPIESMVALKACGMHLPLHIHASEQRREVDGCVEAYGMAPVALLGEHGMLDAGTTLVHATHVTPQEIQTIAAAGAVVCMCPSTEADLGDGLGPASDYASAGITLALGTDGQTLSSVGAEARRLEMHERLRLQRRNVLLGPAGEEPHAAQGTGGRFDVARNALAAATLGGARSLQVDAGALEVGRLADFVSFDLADPHLAGADVHSLLPSLIFTADSRAVVDVIVGGRFIVEEGQHPLARESAAAFSKLSAEIYHTA